MLADLKKLEEHLRFIGDFEALDTIHRLEAEAIKLEQASPFIGSVELIYKEEDNISAVSKVGFMRGFIEKYKDTQVDAKNIFYYLSRLIN